MENLKLLLNELKEQDFFKPGEICVIGCSTSEVIGERIGSVGSMKVAQEIFDALMEIRKETGVTFAFQGCEHINRAITIEREHFNPLTMEEVTVVPATHAGGSMSTYAYRHLDNPMVVEHITADCGIDIGQTMIGMHIKHVAVPVRTSVKRVGDAVVTLATSRPKLIGGERAHYTL
ncbi:TIGR01440 family protein [Staphylococcus simulans]|uniref:TIGR01440 family protein n=1 Tax=Staphylococcus simulans TaxID=1286 RepID=UPI0027FF1174|nr:TIGR01440 family protein [Staphylococcus simulans]MDQ7113224.1 TIGR01440 family protein [Staphylococcus simulans]MDQ7118350.1 TIGR01440 family protein [Staphylococcus simulans]MDU0421435.1 TIGR01440 family protein [Staphylococcus simulans]MDU0468110.1 TIGR01440 family protein [Staphylococcus simulans]WMM10545.1 TIGR01440 family protein [Staphylococcus simulans]